MGGAFARRSFVNFDKGVRLELIFVRIVGNEGKVIGFSAGPFSDWIPMAAAFAVRLHPQQTSYIWKTFFMRNAIFRGLTLDPGYRGYEPARLICPTSS
jgi:hypothetical protein